MGPQAVNTTTPDALAGPPAQPTTTTGRTGTGGPGARGRLVQQLFGLYPVQVMHALVSLDVPNVLADGPRAIADLAAGTGSHGPSLRRLVRAGSALGLLERSAPDQVALTADGRLLTTDEPGSIRNLVLLWGGEGGWRAWGELAEAVRTGHPSYDDVMGMSLFDHHRRHPIEQKVFDDAMAESSRVAAPGVVAVCPLAGHHRLVDVGGGSGNLLAQLLAANPELTGVLFDRPTNAGRAQEVLSAAGLAGRSEFVGGDFFASVPEGADAYLLKSVLHDWDDERSVAILTRVREAMAPGATLFVVEPLVPETDAELRGATMTLISDLNMMACTGGAERTAAEFSALFDQAGLRLAETLPCPPPSNLSVLRVVAG